MTANNQILLLTGCCNSNPSWNGDHYEATIGEYVQDIDRQLRSQGFKISKLKRKLNDRK